MINLYQLLELRPDASAAEIRQALADRQAAGRLDPGVERAARQWLLDEAVRRRYDARLQHEQPQWFAQAAPPVPPKRAAEGMSGTGAAPPRRFKIRGRPAPDAEYGRGAHARPLLWNPLAAALLALFLTPLFVWLHAENWEELGEQQKARNNRLFVYGTAVLSLAQVLLMGLGLWQAPLEQVMRAGAVVNSALWLGWFLTMGRGQVAFVAERFGSGYGKRPWGKAVAMVLLALAGLMMAGMAVLLLLQIAGLAVPPPQP